MLTMSYNNHNLQQSNIFMQSYGVHIIYNIQLINYKMIYHCFIFHKFIHSPIKFHAILNKSFSRNFLSTNLIHFKIKITCD